MSTVLLDTTARWLLVLHTVLGVAAVGAATHLVIWLRRYVRGAYGRRRAVIRFAWIVLAMQIGAFIAGNVMYPTYKVEVRVAYLENSSAITAAEEAREQELHKLIKREGGEARETPVTREMVKRAAAAARWFDIKEHWVALGMIATAVLLLVLARWNPAGQYRHHTDRDDARVDECRDDLAGRDHRPAHRVVARHLRVVLRPCA